MCIVIHMFTAVWPLAMSAWQFPCCMMTSSFALKCPDRSINIIIIALAQGEPLTGRLRRISVMMASAGSDAFLVPPVRHRFSARRRKSASERRQQCLRADGSVASTVPRCVKSH